MLELKVNELRDLLNNVMNSHRLNPYKVDELKLNSNLDPENREQTPINNRYEEKDGVNLNSIRARTPGNGVRMKVEFKDSILKNKTKYIFKNIIKDN